MIRCAVAALALCLVWPFGLAAGPADQPESAVAARKGKVAALVSSAKGLALDGRTPRLTQESGGYVRHLGFPKGRGIEPSGADLQNPRDVTEKFLGEWRDAFVNPSGEVSFATPGVNTHRGCSYVRVQQEYGGLKILCATGNVQVDANGRVQSVLCNLMRDTGVLDRGELSLSPTLSAEAAQEVATRFVSDVVIASASLGTAKHCEAGTPELLILYPPILKREGPTRLVWSTVVRHSTAAPAVLEQVLVDAHTGEIPHHGSLIAGADPYREIYNQNDSFTYELRTRVRYDSILDRDTGINEVDRAFGFFGDVWRQNWEWHDLDSLDGLGHPIRVGVNMPTGKTCYWTDTEAVYFEDDRLIDDCAMHEYTHGVSFLLMDLNYWIVDESAALQEGLSYMWGEWFDMEHDYVSTPGGDPDSYYGYKNKDGYDPVPQINYDWMVHEDQSGGEYTNLKDPTAYGLPDRYLGQFWSDRHANGCVAGKLAYLLSDTEEDSHVFYGFTILPVSLSADPTLRRKAGAELFHHARLQLTGSDGYHALYDGLMTATENLDYTPAQTLNVEKACEAVNIRYGIPGLIVKDDSGASLAFLQDVGKLQLKQTLATGISNINTSDGGLVMKNDAGTVVAFINASSGANGGQMTIRDDLSQSAFPSESANNLLVVRYDGVPVTTLDNTGKLEMSGPVEEEHSF
jgi:Zn-dependent metalloprotease